VFRQALLLATWGLLLAPALHAQRPVQPFQGEPISLDLKDVDLHDFFRLVHEVSGLNIVLDPAVRGTLTMTLKGVPWDQVLDIVLKSYGLVSEWEGNVLRVLTRHTARREQEARKDLARAAQQAIPLRTLTHTFSHARAADAAQILRRFLSPRGEITVDARTNSLIIRDTPAVIEEIFGALSPQEPIPSGLGQPSRRARESPPGSIYAMALKDRIEYAVYSCEVQGEYLHYHTTYGVRTRAPRARVDWTRTDCTLPPAESEAQALRP